MMMETIFRIKTVRIVDAVCFIHSQNVQPHRAPLQILNVMLTVYTLYAQIGAL